MKRGQEENANESYMHCWDCGGRPIPRSSQATCFRPGMAMLLLLFCAEPSDKLAKHRYSAHPNSAHPNLLGMNLLRLCFHFRLTAVIASIDG